MLLEYQGWNYDYFKKASDRQNFFVSKAVHPFKLLGEQINPTEKDLKFYLHLVNGWSNPDNQILELGTRSGAFSLACILAGRNLATIENDNKQVKNVAIRVKQFLNQVSRLPVNTFTQFRSIDPTSALHDLEQVNLKNEIISHVETGQALEQNLCFQCDQPITNPKFCKLCGVAFCAEHYENESDQCVFCSNDEK